MSLTFAFGCVRLVSESSAKAFRTQSKRADNKSEKIIQLCLKGT